MKKAGSRTGLKGLSLVETLLAVLILSSTIVFIIPAFFKSGAIISHLTHRCEADLLISNLIAQKEEDLRTHKQLDSRTSRGEESVGNTVYTYELEVCRRTSRAVCIF